MRNNIILVVGPEGTGKTSMIEDILVDKKHIFLDVKDDKAAVADAEFVVFRYPKEEKNSMEYDEWMDHDFGRRVTLVFIIRPEFFD